MGVPVLTLSGSHHAARVGSTLLRAVGLDDWVAESESAFIQKAIEKSTCMSKLGSLRTSIREQLLVSGLCDTHQFVSNLESAYQQMWKGWLR
jgi:predicted O-linked N-acetylglucosamine transferase (SPINDLY family)